MSAIAIGLAGLLIAGVVAIIVVLVLMKKKKDDRCEIQQIMTLSGITDVLTNPVYCNLPGAQKVFAKGACLKFEKGIKTFAKGVTPDFMKGVSAGIALDLPKSVSSSCCGAVKEDVQDVLSADFGDLKSLSCLKDSASDLKDVSVRFCMGSSNSIKSALGESCDEQCVVTDGDDCGSCKGLQSIGQTIHDLVAEKKNVCFKADGSSLGV